MRLYHASFRGRRRTDALLPLKEFRVVLEADSIYDVKPLLKERYDFVFNLCVTNTDWIKQDIWELAQKEVC